MSRTSNAWDTNPLKGITRHKATNAHIILSDEPLVSTELMTAISAVLPKPATAPASTAKIKVLRDPSMFPDHLRSTEKSCNVFRIFRFPWLRHQCRHATFRQAL